MTQSALHTTEIDPDLLDFCGLNCEDSNNLNFINANMSEISRKLAIFYWTDRKTYCAISSKAQNGNWIEELPEKITNKRVREGMIAKKIRGFGMKKDSVRDKMAEYKNDPSAIDEVRFIFDPHSEPIQKDRRGVFELNSFAKTPLMRECHELRAQGVLTKSLDFLEKMPRMNILLDNLCVDERRKKYFINWLAFIAVELKKTGTAVLFKGTQGTGKGVLWEEVIKPFFGSKFCVELGNQHVTSDFTHPKLASALFANFNEIKGNFSENNTTYEKLKMYITENTLAYTLKGKDTLERSNFFNCIFSSNNSTPLQIQTGDRRYNVFETSHHKLEFAVKQKLNETIHQYIDALRQEVADFWRNLAVYDYDREAVRVPLETAEREALTKATDTKQSQLVSALQNLSETFQAELLDKTLVIMQQNDENEVLNKNSTLRKLAEATKVDLWGTSEQIEASLNTFFRTFNDFVKINGFCPARDISLITRLYMLDENDARGGVINETKFGAMIYNSGSFVRLQKKIGGVNSKCVTCRAWAEAYVEDKNDSVWEALK